MFTALTRTVIEIALDQEMSEHLGYDKHDPAGRGVRACRDGTRSKTALTDKTRARHQSTCPATAAGAFAVRS